MMRNTELEKQKAQEQAKADELNLLPEEWDQLEPKSVEDGGRTFTQAEVNQIVRERLTRERAKNAPSPEEQKRRELEAKELRLKEKEYLYDHFLPVDEIMNLLDDFTINSIEQFEDVLNQILDLMPTIALYADQRQKTEEIKDGVKENTMNGYLKKIFEIGGRV